MSSIGRQVLSQNWATGLQVLWNLDHVEWKPAGVTIDWATVTAVSGADVTLIDGTVILIGEKALRYGQVLTEITASGKYGPYDSTASDGRQTLARGKCFILNQTWKENGGMTGLPAGGTDFPPGVFFKGLVVQARLIAGGQAHELGPLGPAAFVTLEAVVDINYAR